MLVLQAALGLRQLTVTHLEILLHEGELAAGLLELLVGEPLPLQLLLQQFVSLFLGPFAHIVQFLFIVLKLHRHDAARVGELA